MMFVLNRIVFALNGFAILALLLSYTARYISPEWYWPIAFLGLAYPVWVGLNLVFMLYWIVVFKLRFLYSFIAIVLGWNLIPGYLQLKATKIDDRTNSLMLLNFNMKYFGAFDGKKLQETDKFFDIYDKVNPDILCLQECKNLYSPIEKDAYKRLFKKVKKYYSYNMRIDDRGNRNGEIMVILSRFPIIDSGLVEHDPQSANFTIYADIVAYGDTIRIVNTHLQSIKFEEPDYKAIKSIRSPDDSTLTRFTNITRKLKVAFEMRARQSRVVRDFIENAPYKVIVSGDFNDSPASFAYRTVKGNMKDAFMESGSGLGRTYVGAMPSFRIDYILHDPSFASYNYYAKAFEFSDHKMLSCIIKLKP